MKTTPEATNAAAIEALRDEDRHRLVSFVLEAFQGDKNINPSFTAIVADGLREIGGEQ